MASVKKNFAYNLVLTLCNYIFPLLIYPYVSRVLGVTNIGICNFVDSIIQYFVLFSTLGIGSFGVREIARYKENREARDKIFSSLFLLNVITTLLALSVLLISVNVVESLVSYKKFLWIGTIQLVSTLFLTNWFFQGISDFKYITIRTVVVKCFYVLSVFLFVRDENDTIIFYFLTSSVFVLNAIINWIYGNRFRSLVFNGISLTVYLVPVFSFGLYLILTSAYTTFNIVFLGFCSGDTEVGYFTTATKLYSIIMGTFTAFTTVMVPRVSELLMDGNKEYLQKIVTDTLSLIVIFSVPIIVLCEFYAHEIIFLVAGRGYEGAEIPFRIVIFLLLIIGFEQIIIQQFLMASKTYKSIFLVSVTGAVFGLFFNILITPQMASVGSAICWGISELSVLIVGIILINKNLNLFVDNRIILMILPQILYYVIPVGAICLLGIGGIVELLISAFVLLFLFILFNIKLHKNPYITSVVEKFVRIS